MTERAFAPFLPSPFTLGHLTLVGQTADGKFREIKRIKLGDCVPAKLRFPNCHALPLPLMNAML
jgi:hypothetical protein